MIIFDLMCLLNGTEVLLASKVSSSYPNSHSIVHQVVQLYFVGVLNLVKDANQPVICLVVAATSSSNTKNKILMIRDLLETNRKHSTRAIATEINLPKSNAWCIITEKLLMRKVCSTWVPHSLSQINKQSRVECWE